MYWCLSTADLFPCGGERISRKAKEVSITDRELLTNILLYCFCCTCQLLRSLLPEVQHRLPPAIQRHPTWWWELGAGASSARTVERGEENVGQGLMRAHVSRRCIRKPPRGKSRSCRSTWKFPQNLRATLKWLCSCWWYTRWTLLGPDNASGVTSPLLH